MELIRYQNTIELIKELGAFCTDPESRRAARTTRVNGPTGTRDDVSAMDGCMNHNLTSFLASPVLSQQVQLAATAPEGAFF